MSDSRNSAKRRQNIKAHQKKVLQKEKDRPAAERSLFKQSEFVCKPKFRNTITDVPFEPKFLQLPFSASRFFQYSQNSLEKQFRWQPHAEPDLGVQIDLIDPRNTEAPPDKPSLPAEDAVLLGEKTAAAGGIGGADGMGAGRAGGRGGANGAASGTEPGQRDFKELRPHVTWLKKTPYLSNDLYKAVHAFASEQQTKAEKRDAVDAALAQRMLPPQEMLKRIKKSFQVAKGKQQLRHESNPNLTAVKVWSVVPHFSMYQHTHALAEFDYNPTELVPRKGEKRAARAARQADKQHRMLRSIVHNVTAVKGRSAVDEQRMIGSVMLPKRAREHDSEGEGEDGQEFEWDNNSELVLKADKNDTPTLVFSWDKNSDVVQYFEASSRLRVRRTVERGGAQKRRRTERELKVQRRDANLEEVTAMRDMLTHLDDEEACGLDERLAELKQAQAQADAESQAQTEAPDQAQAQTEEAGASQTEEGNEAQAPEAGTQDVQGTTESGNAEDGGDIQGDTRAEASDGSHGDTNDKPEAATAAAPAAAAPAATAPATAVEGTVESAPAAAATTSEEADHPASMDTTE